MKKKAKNVSLVLPIKKAADLMTPNPLSIRASAPISEATQFLADKGFRAAPVIDEGGRPVGVLSQADIVVHDRETDDYFRSVPAFYEEEPAREAPVTATDFATVGDIMTPVVFSVTPDTPVTKVVQDLVNMKVHRLFVVDKDGVLVGVISTLDILRHLEPENQALVPNP